MLRVATWNVENFFHPDAEGEQAQQDAFAAKLEAIVGKVQVVDADVWALQEVGDQQALDDLAAALPRDWHTMLSSHEDGRGIAVGYLSREELHDQVDVVDLPPQLSGGRADDEGHLLTQMGRGALQVRLHREGGEAILINCHLKSKLLTYPGGRFSPRDEDERARYAVYALNRRAAEAGDLCDGAGRERRDHLLGGPAAFCRCAGVVDRAELLVALPGHGDFPAGVTCGQAGVESGDLAGCEVVGAVT